jgi:hypothetical protein
MYKYFFHIIDNEFNDEYDYEAYFYNHEEAAQFIKENEEAGNIITIIAPYYITVEESEVNL